jgi:hypothetical protein
MHQHQNPHSTGGGARQEYSFDDLAPVPADLQAGQHSTVQADAQLEANEGPVEQPGLFRERNHVYAYMHEGDGFELPKLGGLRFHLLIRLYEIDQDNKDSSIGDVVLVRGECASEHLEDFPDAIARGCRMPSDIVQIIADMLPPSVGPAQSNSPNTAPQRPIFRYVDSRLFSQHDSVPYSTGKLDLLEMVPPDQLQCDYREELEELTARGVGYVVLRPRESFRGARTVELLEALYEGASLRNFSASRIKTPADDFISACEQVQTASQKVASLVVDTYMSYALFRGLQLLCESLSEDARLFLNERGWHDLSWRWPGFVEPLPPDDIFATFLAALRSIQARRQDSWIGESWDRKPPELEPDPESIFDDAAELSCQSTPGASRELQETEGELRDQGITFEEGALYERFASSLPRTHNWVGFLRCALEAPLTDKQRDLALSLSWNQSYPDRYHKEGACFISAHNAYFHARSGDTKDFFNRDLKENTAWDVERKILRMLDRTKCDSGDAADADEVTRVCDSILSGEVPPPEDAAMFYATFAKTIARCAMSRVASDAPIANEQRIDCTEVVEEILLDRIVAAISSESCNLLEWLGRFHKLRTHSWGSNSHRD